MSQQETNPNEAPLHLSLAVRAPQPKILSDGTCHFIYLLGGIDLLSAPNIKIVEQGEPTLNGDTCTVNFTYTYHEDPSPENPIVTYPLPVVYLNEDPTVLKKVLVIVTNANDSTQTTSGEISTQTPKGMEELPVVEDSSNSDDSNENINQPRCTVFSRTVAQNGENPDITYYLIFILAKTDGTSEKELHKSINLETNNIACYYNPKSPPYPGNVAAYASEVTKNLDDFTTITLTHEETTLSCPVPTGDEIQSYGGLLSGQ